MAAVYTYDELLTALRKAGLCAGDDVFVHSNIGFFGRLEGASDSQELCSLFIKAILTVIGSKGT